MDEATKGSKNPHMKSQYASGNKWLANAKRLNSHGIRRRMQVQKERLERKTVDSKCSPSPQSLGPTATLEQQVENRPRLAISVTMSEDEDPTAHSNEEVVFHLDSEELAEPDVSAWAMMEHYGNSENVDWDTGVNTIRLSDQDSTGNLSRNPPVSLGPDTVPEKDARLEANYVEVGTQSDVMAAAVYPRGALEKTDLQGTGAHHPRAMDSSPSDVVGHGLQPPLSPSGMRRSNEYCHDILSPKATAPQELVFLSQEYLASNFSIGQTALSERDQQSNVAPSIRACGSAQEGMTPLPQSPFENEERGTPNNDDQRGQANHEIETSAASQSKLQLTISTSPPQFPDTPEIEQLRLSLEEQQASAEQIQTTLVARVQELEQVLRATVATPKGTIMQENPLKTLLDRNQTLVKEVRFADQTCVELSSKIHALEAENESLQIRNLALQKENDALRTTSAESPAIFRSENVIPSGTFRSSEYMQGSDLELLSAAKDLKAEVVGIGEGETDPINVMALSLLSDFESLADLAEDRPELEPHLTSRCLAKSMQLQTQLLRERATIPGGLSYLSMHPKAGDPAQAHLSSGLDHKAGNCTGQAKEGGSCLLPQVGQAEEDLKAVNNDFPMLSSTLPADERNWDNRLANQVEAIQSLEFHLDKAASAISAATSSSETTSGSTYEHTTARENVHIAKEIAKSIRQDCDNYVSKPQQPLPEGHVHREFFTVVQAVLSRMRSQYLMLEKKMESMVDCYTDRLSRLTETVHFLRSSLLFEEDSVTTSPQKDYSASAVNIDTHQSSLDDSDLDRTQEETKIVDKRMSISGDTSTLFADDIDFGSSIKASIDNGSLTDTEQWREPLDSAIKECQRVRERSILLKQEVERQELSLKELRAENGRLSLEGTRRYEELLASQLKGRQLESMVEMAQREKTLVEEQKSETEACCKRFECDKKVLESELASLRRGKDQAEKELVEATQALEESMRIRKLSHLSNAVLARELSTLRTESSPVSNGSKQMSALKESLKLAQAEVEKLKSSHEMTQDELSRELETTNGRASTLTMQLRDHKQLVSELEDQVLEARCRHEDMRKERAELRQKVSQLEDGVAKSKAAFSSYKEQVREEEERKHATIESLESSLAEFHRTSHELAMASVGVVESLNEASRGHTMINIDGIEKGCDGVSSGFLSRLVLVMPVVSEKLQQSRMHGREIARLEDQVRILNDTVAKFSLLESAHIEEIEDERKRHQKLVGLIQQAEKEMEHSAQQIKEMSSALSRLQLQEADVSRLADSAIRESEDLKKKLEQVDKDRREEKANFQFRLSEISNELESKEKNASELSSALLESRAEIDSKSKQLHAKEMEVDSLRLNLETLENKISRLRGCVKQLTAKCEEWESCYETQGRSLQKLRAKNARIRGQSADVSLRYRRLAKDVRQKKERHVANQEKWNTERAELHLVHSQLEKELEAINSELSEVCKVEPRVAGVTLMGRSVITDYTTSG